MQATVANEALNCLREWTECGAAHFRMSDAQLLEQFVQHRDESAFEVLVRRHGPLVRGTCQRVLHCSTDAEDAFQATFLVLVQKASSLRWQTSIAPWLYKVAYRTAQKVRVNRARRTHHEMRAGADSSVEKKLGEGAWDDLQEILDEELHTLPQRYRVVLLLCYLEGLAREEVATRLGVTLSTVKWRLERGRELLRNRLAGRGLALSTVLLGSVLTDSAAAASVPRAWIETAVANGLHGGVTSSLAGAGVDASVFSIAKEVLWTMTMTKIKTALVSVFAVGLLGIGVGFFANSGSFAFGDEQDRKEGDRREDRRDGDRERREGEGDRDRREGDRERREGDREGREGDRRDGDRERREGEGDRDRPEGERREGDRDRREGERREGEGERGRGFRPQNAREAALFEMIQNLRREIGELRQELARMRNGERDRPRPVGEGDRGRREGDRGRERGERDRGEGDRGRERGERDRGEGDREGRDREGEGERRDRERDPEEG